MAPETTVETLDTLIDDARRLQVLTLPRPRMPRTADPARTAHGEIRIPDDTVTLVDGFADYGS